MENTPFAVEPMQETYDENQIQVLERYAGVAAFSGRIGASVEMACL